MFSRKVAVTGATGMVGSHLVAEMVRAGYKDITLIVRNTGRLTNMYDTFDRMGVALPHGVITVVEADLCDHTSLTAKVPGIDTVFNCAAKIMSGRMTSAALVGNNVGIARSVVDWSLATGISKIIHVSSISALEAPADGCTVDENSNAVNPDRFPAYGKSKFYSEQEIWRAADNGIETIVVMPGVILGEGNPGDNNSAAMTPLISSGLPFYTKGLMSYVDVRDVALAMVMLDAAEGATGQRFILSADNISYKKLISLSARTAHRPQPFIAVGKGAVSAAYGAMRCAVKLGIAKDNGVTKENLGSILKTIRYDGSKIERMYGFRYTPLEETITRVVKACRSKSAI